eukprot:365086-Chlamydomonas_euryale.AAC.14
MESSRDRVARGRSGCGSGGGDDGMWHGPDAARGAAQGEGAACADVAALQAPCKFWVNSGRCAKGDRCPFAHPVLTDETQRKELRKAWVEDRCGGPGCAQEEPKCGEGARGWRQKGERSGRSWGLGGLGEAAA